MDSIFNRGFGSQFNTANWAQMPTAQPVQGLPTVQPPIPVPPTGDGIQSVADYNTMTPLAGGTPAGAVPTPTTPAAPTAAKPKGILGALRAWALARGGRVI